MLTEFTDCIVGGGVQGRPLEEKLIYAGLSSGDVIYASGIAANNKLNLGSEELSLFPQLHYEVTHKLGGIVTGYSPDLLIPVPSGANGYARCIGDARNIDYILPPKFELWPEWKEKMMGLIEGHDRIAIIEDIPTRLTSTERTIRELGIGERVVLIAALFDRGYPQHRNRLRRLGKIPRHVPIIPLVRRPLPPVLDDSDPVWEFAHPARRPGGGRENRRI